MNQIPGMPGTLNLPELMKALQLMNFLGGLTQDVTPVAQPASVPAAEAPAPVAEPARPQAVPAPKAPEPTPHEAWDTHHAMQKVKELFGFPNAPDQMVMPVYTRVSDPRVPYRDANPDYQFRRELFGPLASFMANADGDSLLLTGPHGSGKTSVIVEFCARIGQPVMTVTGRKGMEVPDLLGQWVMTDTGFVWVDGPLTQAVRYGYCLVFNEAFLCSPGELTGLNDVAEGNPLCLPQKGGEVVKRHPRFRLVLTDNSGGQGDQTGLYAGVVAQNPSLLDRCCKMTVGYADEATELAVLRKKAAGVGSPLDDEILTRFVTVANAVRDAYLNPGNVELTVTMSTRTLSRWLYRSCQFRTPDGKPDLAGALDFALTGTIDPAERIAIHEIARAKFGQYWTDR